MIWPFANDTREIEKSIAKSSFRANKTRNIIAVIGIILTSILFTSLFTLGIGMIESTRVANMVLSGGDGHARIIELREEEYETISSHPLVREIAYCRRLADSINNEALSKREMEFSYYDDMGMKYMFTEPSGGSKPQAENEIMTDTKTLELLGVEQKAGEEISLELTIHNEPVTRNFILSGWWETYPGVENGTILASRDYVEAHREELNAVEEGQQTAGAITAVMKFENAGNVKEDLETVVRESGYSMDYSAPNYINAGANPLYLSLETSNYAGTVFGLACGLFLFLSSGYLIIYNIFQISVLRDLHFFGLLKTIGATGRQINSIIRRQVWALSVIGIPIGLFGGFLIGKGLLPMLMEQTSFSGDAAAVSANPVIFFAAGVFAFVTVRISAGKPAKIAAKVSPIEAVRYVDSEVRDGNKKRRFARPGRVQNVMARANLGRNRKRTFLVVLSLCLSILIANTVFIFSHSVNPEKAISNMIDFDFCIGQNELLKYYVVEEESALTESFAEAVKAQEGFETGGYEYGCNASYNSETTTQSVNQFEDGSFSTQLYGLDPVVFSRAKLVDGELDMEKLAGGEYILEGAHVTTRGVMEEDSINHSVGDRVELNVHGEIRSFTVLGHILANETNTYDWVGSCFFLPDTVYREFTGNSYPMTYKFDTANEKEMEAFLKRYTENEEPDMTYKSRSTIMAGTADIRNTVVSVGGTIAGIIGLIGILNFANTILTSMYTRRRELATLQSIGMTGRQIMNMLCLEGCNYMLLSVLVSVPLCMIGARMLVQPICEKIWFLDFRMSFLPLLVIIPILLLTGILVPCITYQQINRQSVTERLKGG
ncbi:MAG: ABC transporter permease [Clostridiales bacterium]|nr:ABC transporter permease [Clostridiales bacterium]